MTNPFRIALLTVVIACSVVTGCGDPTPTVILVTVDRRPSVWPIDRLEVSLDNAGQTQRHSFALAGQTFPVTFTVSAHDREGAVRIALEATDANGLIRAKAVTTADLSVDNTVETALLMQPTDFVVNTNVAGEQRLIFTAEESGRQLAVSPGGAFMTVFEDDCGALNRCDMFARLFDQTTHPAPNDTSENDSAFIANLVGDAFRVAPSVAANDDGYLLVWEGDAGIAAVALSDRGAHTVVSEIDVSAASTGFPYSAHVATLVSGEFVVVWAESDDDGSGTIVKGRLLDNSGTPVVNAVSGDNGPFRISTAPSVFASGPVVAATSSSRGFVVAWRAGTDLRARFYDPAGAPRTGTELSLVSYAAGATLLAPHIAWHKNTAIVSWAVLDTTPGSWPDGALLVAGFEPPSGSRSTPILVVEDNVPGVTGPLPASAPAITEHGEHLALAWHSCAAARADDDGCAVRHQLLRSSLLPLGDPAITPSTTSGDQTTPSVGSLGAGLIVTWTDGSAQAPDSSGLAVRARVVYPVTEPVDGRRGARCGRQGDAPCADRLVCLVGAAGTPLCHDQCDTTASAPQCARGGLCTRQGEVDGCLF